MAIPRQKQGLRWLFAQTGTYDLLIAGFACVIGITSAVNYSSQGKQVAALLAGGGTIGVLVFTAVKQIVGLTAARKKESVHELEGCLFTLHAALDPTAGAEPGRLRLAIHVPAGEMLEQVTEYIGDRPKAGRVGRQYPANSGIIGKAYRENEVFVSRRVNDDYNLFIKELVKEWNYTEDRARHLNPAVKAWMAVPFFDEVRNTVEAVLYLDSTDAEFFDPVRQELVLAAVSGIAVFIGKRYTRSRD
jgi:hypothetical protein